MSRLQRLEAVLLDIGGTLVEEAAATQPIDQLVPRLLPAVREDLQWLSGRYRLAAVTNTTVMTERDVRHLLEIAGIGRYLELVLTSVDIGAAKPDPLPIQVALRRLGVTPAAALYVGDRDTDRAAAAAAGCRYAAIGNTLRETVEQHLAEAPQRDEELRGGGVHASGALQPQLHRTTRDRAHG